MTRFSLAGFIGGVALAVSVWHVAALAQTPAADERIWAGVYSTAQATRGKAVYEAYCTRCHGIDMVGGRQGNGGGPQLAGSNFWLGWERETLANLFSKISKTMPYDSPGSLRSDDYGDLLAYILQGNKFPAGASDIPASGSGLDSVRIVRRAGEVTVVPDFALVQVVGCLSSDNARTARLTRATAPLLTREEVPGAEALTDARTRSLGEDVFTLIGTGAFTLGPQAGQRVEARGLLRHAGGDAQIDLLSLQVVGPPCTASTPSAR